MKGLIIAAGMGSRIAAIGPSKPLIPLLDTPLIEWVIRTAQQSGVDEFYVVTGYNGAQVRSFLEQLSSRLEVPINPLVNEDWQKQNGLSVLKARHLLDGPFALCMSDHIFESQILTALCQAPLADDGVVLAVDYGLETNRLVDLEDVTKVLVEEDRIVDIGKDIPHFNAYDTGIFCCTPALFEAIETSVTDFDDGSLSGAMRVLGRQGKAHPFDIGTSLWFDVDNDLDFQKAEEILLSDRFKGSQTRA